MNARTYKYRGAFRSRNVQALIYDFASFGGAYTFISFSTILPAFVSTLTSSNIAIGLITSASFLGFNLPQILVSNKVEKLTYKKRYVLTRAIGERFPWLILGICTLFLLPSHPAIILLLFYVILFVTQLSGGMGSIAWFDIVGKVVPSELTSSYFGLANFLGSLFGVVAGVLSAFYFEVLEYPTSFAACFFSCFILMASSFIVFARIREPPSEVHSSDRSFKEYVVNLPSLLSEDKQFRKYLIASTFGGLSSMGPAFFMAAAIYTGGLAEGQVGLLTASSMLGQVLSNLLWMRLAPRWGNKYVLIIGSAANLIACLLAIFSRDFLGFLTVFALSGISFTSFMVSGLAMVYDFSPENKRPTYFALSGLVRAPFMMLAPIVGGVIADLAGYPPVLIIASLTLILHIVSLFLIKVPQRGQGHIVPSRQTF